MYEWVYFLISLQAVIRRQGYLFYRKERILLSYFVHLVFIISENNKKFKQMVLFVGKKGIVCKCTNFVEVRLWHNK